MVKLKLEPEDFRVREVLDFVEDPSGSFFIHRLKKSKCDTTEAIGRISKGLRIRREKFAFAGLKDRQGVTEQYVSVEGRPAEFHAHGIDMRLIGRAAEPITSKQSRGNDFRIVMRDVFVSQIDGIEKAIERSRKDGFANYFDDQRFGSLKHGQGFPMREVAKGEFERALKAMIARPSKIAISGDVRLKKLLAGSWGDWERCDRIARGPQYFRLFQRLIRDPEDFHGALQELPQRQLLIHAFAYQSYLWNRACDLWIGKRLPGYRQIRIQTEAGSFRSWSKLKDEIREEIDQLRTPMPGPGGDGGDDSFRSAMDRVLRDADIELNSLADHRIPGMILKEEPRRLLVRPRNPRVLEVGNDERNRRMKKVVVSFGLPRGAYATMLIKHITAESPERGRGPRPGRRERMGEERPPAGPSKWENFEEDEGREPASE
ncbi:MAG: tRNA pseudouridine(13) synthase TruD [Planctomycetota bacterium]